MTVADGSGMTSAGDILLHLTGYGSFVGFAERPITIGQGPWQGSQWMSQYVAHVKFPAFSNKDHLAKQLPVSLQDHLFGMALGV